ncbi:expressed unknown protein [Seminavis robusta]|uniref:Uncharacterized protein n=1 Tax=Seminavis robusta TaxID=568900 RepID=A0A9N8D6R3_9STRA|nr:expressed unknown protein [Seminavis robusta]|eukprot:Sro3_g002200.1 n/a (535) ;mRNA; f:84295-85899
MATNGAHRSKLFVVGATPHSSNVIVDQRTKDGQQKLQNEQRRASVWQSETIDHSRTHLSRSGGDNREIVDTGTNTHRESVIGSGEFLREKQHIATRSFQRMSSRRSLVSSSSGSNRSLMSEKSAISERSERRVKTRAKRKSSSPDPRLDAASASFEEEEEIDYYPKAGTAEAVLPTLEESGMEFSYRSDTTSSRPAPLSAPQPGSDIPWYPSSGQHPHDGSGLVMAVVVDEEEEAADIPYATAVSDDTEKICCHQSRLSPLLWLALFCIVSINAGVVVTMLKNQSSSDPSSDAAFQSTPDEVASQQPRPVDLDDATDSLLPELSIPTLSPNLPPTQQPATLNNGRPPNNDRTLPPAGSPQGTKPTTEAPISTTLGPSLTLAPSREPSVEPDLVEAKPTTTTESVVSYPPSTHPSVAEELSESPSFPPPTTPPTSTPPTFSPTAPPSFSFIPVVVEENRRPGSLNPLVYVNPVPEAFTFSSCGSYTNGGACMSTPGCSWHGGTCSSTANAGSCSSYTNGGACKSAGCLWEGGTCS